MGQIIYASRPTEDNIQRNQRNQSTLLIWVDNVYMFATIDEDFDDLDGSYEAALRLGVGCDPQDTAEKIREAGHVW